jgi:Fe2+ transport system protein FeoA
MNIKNLGHLDDGTVGKILSISGERNARQQLRELGLFPGDTVRVIRHAAFGGPLLVECRGTQIAIGLAIAENVEVE